ncbi:MAG: DegT/DnrJ/EryC1/StrS family aminotransferase, partial [Pseudomonadales bacterium]
GLVNLQALPDFIAANKRNYLIYSEALAGVDGLRLIAYDEADTPNYQYVVIELESPVAGGRDAMVAALHAENILARKYFWPGCHRMKPYRDLYPHASLLLPDTIKVASQAVVLPTGITLGADDIETVARIVAMLARSGRQAP